MSTEQAKKKLHGYAEQAAGTVKENVGQALGKEELRKEGLQQRTKGKSEVEDARMATGAGTVGGLMKNIKEAAEAQVAELTTRAQSLAGQAAGTLKESIGHVLGKKELEAEGKAQREQAARLWGVVEGRERVGMHIPYELLETINKGNFHLKHVEICCDKSKPMIDKTVKIKKHNRRAMFDEIKRGRFNLRHVETREVKPVFPEKWKLKRMPRQPFLDEIRRGNFRLKPATTCDKSKPRIHGLGMRKFPDSLLNDITRGKPKLKHTEIAKDWSKPMIAKNIHLKKLDRSALLEDVKHANVKLKHVNTCDKTKVMMKDVHLRKVDRKPFLDEVRRGSTLKHVSH
jgi:uncharacterized protein YjbJ (UPF0337 family)